jgi:hypothetical protein
MITMLREFGGAMWVDLDQWSVSPPPTLALPVGPEPLGVMPCEPAPEIPVTALLRPRLVRGTHKIECDSRARRCHPVFRLLRAIEALEWGAGTVLEMRELVDAAVTRTES